MTFNANELQGMKRGELQKLCKSVGIKANSKVCASLLFSLHVPIENYASVEQLF